MRNQDLRREVTRAGVRWWRIAEVMAIPDSSLSRKLRQELPDDEKMKIREIVKRLKGGDGNDLQ